MINPIQLTEQHRVKANHPLYEEIDKLCFLSKNLYNVATFNIRKVFIDTTKEKEAGNREHAEWLRYNALQKLLQDENNVDYVALPRKVSQQVLMQVDKVWKSFFEANKGYNQNPGKYTGRPKLPGFKEKQTGRNMLVYTIQAISRVELRDGIVALSGTNIKIPTKQAATVCQVRIVPKIGYYVIEIVYEKEKEVADYDLDKSKVAGIDMGVDNLAAVTSNVGSVTPLLINGGPLKAINNYYNKKLAELKSIIKTGTSRRIRRMTTKRNDKIDYYLHCASKYIIQHLCENHIGTLVIGKNLQWKTKVNLGDSNNQKFVQIPHARFISMLQYKAEMVGIDVILREEAHTSKTSFIDMESIEHHDVYLGRRVKRGLFVSSKGVVINADCNGSGNIIRKVIPNAFTADGIKGVVVRPTRVTLNPKALAKIQYRIAV